MKKEIIQFRITKNLKDKLITDSIINGFPNRTAYLIKLIESGLATSGTLDMKLNLIDQKMGMLPGDMFTLLKNQSHEIGSALNDINRRAFIALRISAFILAHIFLMVEGEEGGITKSEYDEVDKFINKQMKLFEEITGIK